MVSLPQRTRLRGVCAACAPREAPSFIKMIEFLNFRHFSHFSALLSASHFGGLGTFYQ